MNEDKQKVKSEVDQLGKELEKIDKKKNKNWIIIGVLGGIIIALIIAAIIYLEPTFNLKAYKADLELDFDSKQALDVLVDYLKDDEVDLRLYQISLVKDLSLEKNFLMKCHRHLEECNAQPKYFWVQRKSGEWQVTHEEVLH